MTRRMTADEYQKLQATMAGKPAKEGRIRGKVPTEVDGIKFDSTGEARRWAALSTMAKLGHIKNLRRQVSFTLQGQDGPITTEKGNPRRMVVDFAYIDQKGREVVEDFKGWETPESELKRDILRAQGVHVRVVKASTGKKKAAGLTDRQLRDRIVGGAG